jgi:hypothetical protein
MQIRHSAINYQLLAISAKLVAAAVGCQCQGTKKLSFCVFLRRDPPQTPHARNATHCWHHAAHWHALRVHWPRLGSRLLLGEAEMGPGHRQNGGQQQERGTWCVSTPGCRSLVARQTGEHAASRGRESGREVGRQRAERRPAWINTISPYWCMLVPGVACLNSNPRQNPWGCCVSAALGSCFGSPSARL